ncbi:hypothetical protein [Clostridium sp. DJ247]|uniref:hypothetical protein n=1 Tax=Clostridium sp. DJ247 TaxID=2726188 RepID=UPI001624B23A|nr:hypothetical protein [Clostridium sp. DJ247]MBC2581424.1 hypothetical protein [Clostridium sp. DJ247]
MIREEEQSFLIVKGSTAFLYINDFNDILHHKNEIDENISKDEIIVLTIIWNSSNIASSISKDQRLEIHRWFNSLEILSIAVVDNLCSGDLLELIMLCDIRLGGNNLSIQFPDSESEFVFNFEERCQLLMGNKRNIHNYSGLLGKILNPDEVYNLGLINKAIDIEDMVNEVQNYINKIIGSKNNNQVKAIIRCFNNYKQFGLNSNEELLLEQESKQFCKLILKEYLKKEDM